MPFDIEMRPPGAAFNIKLILDLQGDVIIVETGDASSIHGNAFTPGSPPTAVVLLTEQSDTVTSSASASTARLTVVRLRPVGDRYGTNYVWLDDVEGQADAGIVEAGDTVAAAGSVILDGAAAIAEDGDTMAAGSTVEAAGAVGVGEDGDTIAAGATVEVSGVGAITEDGDTVSGAVAVEPAGAAAVAEDGDTMAASAEATNNSSAVITEDGDTVSIAANAVVSASGTVIEDGDTVSSAVDAVVSASGTVVEDGDTVSSSPSTVVSSSGTVVEDGDTMTMTADVAGSAQGAAIEAGDIVAGAGTVDVNANGVAVEAGDTLVGMFEIGPALAYGGILEVGDTAAGSVNVVVSGFGDVYEPGDTIDGISIGIVSDSPVLFARGRTKTISLIWTINPLVQVLRFDLFKSIIGPPAFHGDGELVYSGLLRSFVDENAEQGVRYYYTVFGVLQMTPLGVTPFDEKSTAAALLRDVFTSPAVTEEYIPTRGEFGVVARPLPFTAGHAWGDIEAGGIRRSDVLVSRRGQTVLSPISGVVIAADDRLFVVEGSGFRFLLSGIVLKDVAVGQRLRAGDVVGVLVSNQMILEIHKLPVGRYGLRSVRPTKFYLELDQRDGRGRPT